MEPSQETTTQTPTRTPPEAEALWSISDVAIYTRRSRRTVERWLFAGLLPVRRLPSGRPVFVPSEIRALVEGDGRW